MTTTNDQQAPHEGVLMALSIISRIICVLLGTMAGFRLLFDWTFEPTMLAGACALAAAVIPPSRPGSNDHRSLAILVLALLGFLFQAADVVVYYYQHDFSGKHYWWSGAIAYFAGLTLMAAYGAVTLFYRGRVKAVKDDA
jgi:small-conductance mechanosensitive channel